MPKLAEGMRRFLSQFRAPIFKHKGSYGDGWGSGSYLKLGDRPFILTNEHIAAVRANGQVLIHQLNGEEDLRPVRGNHVEQTWPFDLALLPVDEHLWTADSNKSHAITVDQISLSHSPVPFELLSFTGFGGQDTKFYFESLLSKPTCLTAREIELPKDERFDSRYHFGINYRPDLATPVTPDAALPLPPGLSGSTVWNTRFVEARMIGREWMPEMAQVTGVVWGWPTDIGCLVATRAEYLRSFLLQVLIDPGK